MAESIFTSQIPGNLDASSPGGLTLCTLFSSAVNGFITGIRWYFPITAPSTNPIGLLYAWTGDGTPSAPLAQKTFSVIPSNNWGTILFDTPVAITAGTFYYSAVWTPDQFVSTLSLFLGSGITNGNLTAPQTNDGIPRRNGRFAIGSPAAYPTNSVDGNGYFADVLFQTTPAVTGTAVADLGALNATAIGAVTHPGTGLADLGALGATATGTPVHPGTGLADLGALGATAIGSVIHPGTGLADLGALDASAIGNVTAIVNGTGSADLGRLIATATTPEPPDPDQFVSLLMDQLLRCLCEKASAQPNPPQHCCFRVGNEVAHDAGILEDLCCEGLAYVSLGGTYPSSDSFPEADIVRQANSSCAPPTWAQEFQVGIIRCVPTGNQFLPPSCEEWNAASRQNVVDAQTLRRVACCIRNFVMANELLFGMSIVIDRQIQGTPQGGCVERSMKITIQIPNCDGC